MPYPELHLVIDGQFLPAGSRQVSSVQNPATDEILAKLPHATQDDLDRALRAADLAFKTWRQVAPLERARVIKRGADLVRERADGIATILTLEQGKTVRESRAEVHYAADVLEWYAEECKRAYGRVIPSRNADVRQLVLLEPVGVAAAFTPWNFPALSPARKIGGALAAGCSLILKAAETTPGTALQIARALHDAGLPAGVLNLVFGDPSEISSYLIRSDIVRKISFTGSVAVGKQLMRQAADGLKRTTMELGGHAPVLVFDDVEVARVVDNLVAGKYRNAGQVCVSPTRFYVQDRIYDQFVDRFAAAARAIVVGSPLDDATGMGPLAGPRRIEAMERLMADALEHGGRLRAGGSRVLGNQGSFFLPTVITDLHDDALLMTEEPFGPIAPIVPFRELADVLERANSLPFGLAAFAFTRSDRLARLASDGLKAGMIGLNTLAISTPETPFGGVRESGQGQEGGVEGLQAYFDVKLVAHAA
jgi:succinate-semialdehyde dehydrogenase/glutarate-semialdehyde dehydrogenase